MTKRHPRRGWGPSAPTLARLALHPKLPPSRSCAECQQALGNEQIPDRYYGLTSVSDNMFDALQRAATLVVLVREFGSNIEGTASVVGKENISKELWLMEHFFEHQRSFFQNGIEEVRKIAARVQASVI